MGDERYSEEWPNIPWSIKPEFSSVWICWSWPLWIGQWWRAVGKEGGGGVRSWRKCHHPVPVQSLHHHHHHHHHHHCIDKHHRRHHVVIMVLMPIRGRTCRKCHQPVPVLSLKCAEDFSRRPITQVGTTLWWGQPSTPYLGKDLVKRDCKCRCFRLSGFFYFLPRPFHTHFQYKCFFIFNTKQSNKKRLNTLHHPVGTMFIFGTWKWKW